MRSFNSSICHTSTAVLWSTGLTILRTGKMSPFLEGGCGSLAPSSCKTVWTVEFLSQSLRFSNLWTATNSCKARRLQEITAGYKRTHYKETQYDTRICTANDARSLKTKTLKNTWCQGDNGTKRRSVSRNSLTQEGVETHPSKHNQRVTCWQLTKNSSASTKISPPSWSPRLIFCHISFGSGASTPFKRILG